jgi:hypothetical protein
MVKLKAVVTKYLYRVTNLRGVISQENRQAIAELIPQNLQLQEQVTLRGLG